MYDLHYDREEKEEREEESEEEDGIDYTLFDTNQTTISQISKLPCQTDNDCESIDSAKCAHVAGVSISEGKWCLTNQ